MLLVFTVLCATADAACVACVGGTAGDCKGARYAVSSLLNVQLCFAICMHNLGKSNNKRSGSGIREPAAAAGLGCNARG